MALRQIVKIDDNILREKSKTVTVFDQRLSILIDDMIETMFKANGAGLAAPQVGVLKRVCVVNVEDDVVYELINPIIVKESGSQIGCEGCLSIPNKSGYVKRPKKLVVEAQNRNGEKVQYKVEDYTAVAFCHEIDHLDGILYVDKTIEDYEENI